MSNTSHALASRILDDAVGAWGPCTPDALISELMFQCGMDRASAAEALRSWALNPSVRVDQWGSYYRPGTGGM